MARRRLRIGAGERMQRVRRISTTFGRVYLGLRTHRWIERRLGPSDMEERWRRFHRSSAQSVYDLAVDLHGSVYVGGSGSRNAFRILTPGPCSTVGIPCKITEIIDTGGDGSGNNPLTARSFASSCSAFGNLSRTFLIL